MSETKIEESEVMDPEKLRQRGFVGVTHGTHRCWCGRPRKESTGRCLKDHEWPRAE